MPQSRVPRLDVPAPPKATVVKVVKGFRPIHALLITGRGPAAIEVSREQAMTLVKQLLDGVDSIDRLESLGGD